MIRAHTGPHLPDGLPCPDVYFHPGYGQAAGTADSGEWILLEAFDGDWQVPLILRALPDGARDAISPTFSGAYASPSLTPAQTQQAWSATTNALRELGVISVLLRGSPLVPQGTNLPGTHPIVKRPTIVVENTTVEAGWMGMHKSCRRRTRKALDNGYTGAVRAATQGDLAPGNAFRSLYEATMQRLGVDPLYFFTDTYYSELLHGLGSNLLICEVRDPIGGIASSDLLLRHGHRLHPHLGGSNPELAAMGANNLMIWTQMQYAVEQGLQQLHLGAGASLNDGVFTFKRSFGGRQLEYAVTAQIIDHQGYERQIHHRATACGVSTEALLATSFFPAYRAGTPHV